MKKTLSNLQYVKPHRNSSTVSANKVQGNNKLQTAESEKCEKKETKDAAK